MLTYIEQLDNDLKRSGSDHQAKDNKGKSKGDNNESKQEDELDQIAGGKEAEIE